MKRLLAVLVALTVALAMLAACETAAPKKNTKAEPPKKEAPKPTAAAPAAAPAKAATATPAATPAPAAPAKPSQKQATMKDGKAVVTINDKKQITVGSDKWTGADDCSAVAMVEKTAAGIVATVTVTDDKMVFAGPADAVHESDGIEFYLDERPAAKRGKAFYDKGVVQIQVMPNFGAKPDAIKVNTGGQEYAAEIPGIKSESKKVEKGYEIKLTIPAEGLAKNHYPLEDAFAFDISVNDSDGGAERDSQIMAFGNNDNWQDPSAFAVADFGKK